MRSEEDGVCRAFGAFEAANAGEMVGAGVGVDGEVAEGMASATDAATLPVNRKT